MGIEDRKLAGALGAEVLGVDLAALDDGTTAAVRRALLDNLVIVFRDQTLTPETQLAFARRFGEPMAYPFVKGLDGWPEITPILKREDDRSNFGGIWHSDTTYLPTPPLATILYALETPSFGGDTLFTNTTAAYDALSDGMKRLLGGLTGVNSAGLRAGGGRAALHANNKAMKIQNADNADSYEAEHPVVRTHPDTGRKSLYLGMHVSHVDGMPEAEGKAMLDAVLERATVEANVYRHQWRPGDLVMWDNRCLLHRADRNYQMDVHPRILHRTVVRGTVPV